MRSKRRSARSRRTPALRVCPRCGVRSPPGSDRRYGAAIDPDTQILPTLGSKELVFSLAQAVLDPAAGKDLVLTTAPGYPIPERGARYAGGDVQRLRLTEERGFLPDLGAITDEQWARASAPVAELSEQPDRRGGAAVVPGRGGRAMPHARRVARLRRGLQRAVVRRRAAARRAAAAGPHQRGGAQHAEQAFVDDRLPQRLRGRRPDPDRARSSGSARRSASPRRSSSSARASRRGATSATSSRTGRGTRPSGRCSSTCSRGTACTSPAARQPSTSG